MSHQQQFIDSYGDKVIMINIQQGGRHQQKENFVLNCYLKSNFRINGTRVCQIAT